MSAIQRQYFFPVGGFLVAVGVAEIAAEPDPLRALARLGVPG
jgi:hypothetical protein